MSSFIYNTIKERKKRKISSSITSPNTSLDYWRRFSNQNNLMSVMYTEKWDWNFIKPRKYYKHEFKPIKLFKKTSNKTSILSKDEFSLLKQQSRESITAVKKGIEEKMMEDKRFRNEINDPEPLYSVEYGIEMNPRVVFRFEEKLTNIKIKFSIQWDLLEFDKTQRYEEPRFIHVVWEQCDICLPRNIQNTTMDQCDLSIYQNNSYTQYSNSFTDIPKELLEFLGEYLQVDGLVVNDLRIMPNSSRIIKRKDEKKSLQDLTINFVSNYCLGYDSLSVESDV